MVSEKVKLRKLNLKSRGDLGRERKKDDCRGVIVF